MRFDAVAMIFANVASGVLSDFAPASITQGRIGGHVGSGGFKDGHYGRSATEELEPAGVGGSLLMRA
jgi:hypothetical protein